MRTIILMRHADARNFGPNGEILNDFERKLTSKGESDAEQSALALKAQFQIDLIVSSNAARACGTAKFLLDQFPNSFFRQEELLYEGSKELIKRFIWSIEDEFNTICIVGHNPTISTVAQDLSNGDFIGIIKPGEYVITTHEI
ncbi:MAG: hypothetical protein EB127_25465 [Alphaproteobacteria bacterium]|nr:hypothetical protein [Alphaproteobacteria bacterium]